MASFGADVTGNQLKSDVSYFAGQLYALLEQFDGWVQRIEDTGGPTGETILAAYQAVDSASASANCTALAEFIGAVGIVAQFAKATTPAKLPLPTDGQTVIDGTATGYTEQSVAVPVGAKGYIVTDANWMAQHDSIGSDKSATIRSGAPAKSY